MSTNFSTISSLNPATVSKSPAYSKNSANAQTAPLANQPVSGGQTQKKSSHWFLKTLAAAVVVVGGLAAARKWCPGVKTAPVTEKLATGAEFKDKAAYYVGKAGQAIIDCAENSIKWVTNLFKGDKAKKAADEVIDIVAD